LSRVPLSDDGVVVSVEQNQLVLDAVESALSKCVVALRTSSGFAEATLAANTATARLR